MCGELKPRSGPEGAGLPGAAMERLSTGAAMCGLCHVLRPGRQPLRSVANEASWPETTTDSDVHASSGSSIGGGAVRHAMLAGWRRWWGRTRDGGKGE